MKRSMGTRFSLSHFLPNSQPRAALICGIWWGVAYSQSRWCSSDDTCGRGPRLRTWDPEICVWWASSTLETQNPRYLRPTSMSARIVAPLRLHFPSPSPCPSPLSWSLAQQAVSPCWQPPSYSRFQIIHLNWELKGPQTPTQNIICFSFRVLEDMVSQARDPLLWIFLSISCSLTWLSLLW